jgi:hypothetical protein
MALQTGKGTTPFMAAVSVRQSAIRLDDSAATIEARGLIARPGLARENHGEL